MKTISQRRGRIPAFTLIELLVVIAIIAILAGFMFPVMSRVSQNRSKRVAFVELGLVQTAIEAYHAKYNMYPPDNQFNAAVNPLYFELAGTVFDGVWYNTLDGRNRISPGQITAFFALSNLVNSSTSPTGTDDRPAPVAFIKELKPDQIGVVAGRTVLVCTENLSPWMYNSSHPTNNPSSFDLWIDLKIGSKTNRISNWSREAIVLP